MSLTGKYAINLLLKIFQPSQDSIKNELDRQLSCKYSNYFRGKILAFNFFLANFWQKKDIANFEIEIMNDFIICNATQMK